MNQKQKVRECKVLLEHLKRYPTKEATDTFKVMTLNYPEIVQQLMLNQRKEKPYVSN
jgi:hypothetical protein